MRIRSVIFSPAALLAASVALLCTALQLAGLDAVLRFDREAIANGRWWLLLTGNFVHLGIAHLLLNLAGLALIAGLVWPNYSAVQWAIVIITSSLGVGLGLYLRDPEVLWYVGFSGTLHGLIIAGTLADFKRYPVPALVLLILVCAKLGYEQVYGSVPGSASVAGGAVVVNSHLYGAISGAIVGIALLGREKLVGTR